MNSYSPCIVIPNYNHSIVFESVIVELLPFEIPIIVVNDGSNEKTSALLNRIAKKQSLVSLVVLDKNQGKGGAVMAGIHYANELNYTHVLQVDADGQHNLSDIELFFEKSKKNPDRLICGYPAFDESVPLSRKIPRYITHFWVWIETLSFSIKDSMCGFRVYPLTKLIPLLNSVQLGKRMDFDIEVLVRLYWQSVEIEFVQTKVIYPEQGVSHFLLWSDNWLITKLHTKLFFSMLVRIPLLIKRNWQKKTSEQPVHWSAAKEKGNPYGIRLLVLCYKIFGKAVFKIILHPIIAYFTIFSLNAKKASIEYQQQLASFQGKELNIGYKEVYAHFYSFANAAIDKIGSWMGEIKEENVSIHNDHVNDEILSKKKGAVFIGSHLGNLELSRAIGQNRNGLVINALVFNKNALKFQNVLNQSNPNVRLNLIHVESVGIDTAIMLKQKIDKGEVIIIVGDRTSVNSIGRVEEVDFLGKPAPFPQGPFILAGILECPVYLIFCIEESNGYNVYLEPFSDSLKLPRGNRKKILHNNIQKYADRLGFYCQKTPLQWFNFFDFWQTDNKKLMRHKN